MGTRLTERTNNAVVYIGRHTKLPGIDGASSMTVAARRDVMDRLAEYEDTGLAPEEIATLKRILDTDLVTVIQAMVEKAPEMVQRALETMTPAQIEKVLQDSLLKN